MLSNIWRISVLGLAQGRRFYARWLAIFLSTSSALGQTIPVFITQPQSQTANVGGSVTFWVTVADGSAPPSLPFVNSGDLQLWLTADTDVSTDLSNSVSYWSDQSGNGNDAEQAYTNNQPLLVNPPGLGGRPAIRFNGMQDNTNGDYLEGIGFVQVPNAMTSFTVYNAFSTANAKNVIWMIGLPGGALGSCRGNGIAGADLVFSGWGDDSTAPFVVPTNTYRIWTDVVDTNLDNLDMFD